MATVNGPLTYPRHREMLAGRRHLVQPSAQSRTFTSTRSGLSRLCLLQSWKPARVEIHQYLSVTCSRAALPSLSSWSQMDHSVITGWEHVSTVLETVMWAWQRKHRHQRWLIELKTYRVVFFFEQGFFGQGYQKGMKANLKKCFATLR